MTVIAAEQLLTEKCRPCEGGVDKFTPEEAAIQVKSLAGWRLSRDGQRIEKHWHVKDFMAGIAFFQEIAKLAEAEGHHPDLHLEGYRHVWIELRTHAIGGLSANDFIMAAKIDRLPVELKGGL